MLAMSPAVAGAVATQVVCNGLMEHSGGELGKRTFMAVSYSC